LCTFFVRRFTKVGVSAAVCNAIYHATGRQVHAMTPDKVMAPANLSAGVTRWTGSETGRQCQST
jgi:hypothetical protein